MRRKLLSILLTLVMVVSFMPVTGAVAFAEEGAGQDVQEPAEEPADEPEFDSSAAVKGLGLASYRYNSVTLKWKAVEGAEGYQIYRASSKSGKYSGIKTTQELTFKDTGNKSLGVYKYYKVRAYGKLEGRTVYGAFSSIYAAKPKLPAPTVKSTSGRSRVKLSWNKVAGATSYRVYRATSKTGTYSHIKTTTGSSHTNVCSYGKKYYYKVRAYRNGKAGVTSSPVQGLATLNPPAGVKATLQGDAIKLTWSSVSNAAYYEIFRSESSKGTFSKVGESSKLSYLDRQELAGGTQYFYKVRAVSKPNGIKQNGRLSGLTKRDKMVEQALNWYGYKEADKSNKVIVDLYNKEMGTSFSYRTPWCAIFVSACAIKTGNGNRSNSAKIVPTGCYCPSLVSTLKKWGRYSSNKKRIPSSGDIIFYDWPRHNGVADHVGLIVSYDPDKKRVTAIEGNTRGSEKSSFGGDSVVFRYYSPGYSDVLGYGLPKYDTKKVSASAFYEAPEMEDPVEEPEIEEAAEAAMAAYAEEPAEEAAAEVEMLASAEEGESAEDPAAEEATEAVAETAAEETAGEEVAVEGDAPESDMEKLENLLEYIEDENPAEKSDADEDVYNAFLLMNVCEELDIDACVLVTVDESGNTVVWNQMELDGQLYTLDPSEKGSNPEILTPENIN